MRPTRLTAPFAGIMLAAVVTSALVGAAPPTFVLIALAAGVAILGVPHGALDPFLARAAGLWRTPLELVGYIGVYLAIAAAVIGAWIVAPGLTLALFLLASAWHFGGDWTAWTPRWIGLVGGASVVTLPALAHQALVSTYFEALAPGAGAALAETAHIIAYPIAAALIAAVIAAAAHDRSTALELTVIGVGAIALPPLVFFIVYFCGLHSPRHIKHAAQDLGVSTPQVIALAVPFTLATFGLAAAAWTMIASTQWDAGILRVVFIGLAALTAPHMAYLALIGRRQSAATPMRGVSGSSASRKSPPTASSLSSK